MRPKALVRAVASQEQTFVAAAASASAAGVAIEIEKAKTKPLTLNLSDTDFIHLAADCHEFQRSRRYALHPVNREETDFPIAFSISMFKEVAMFERLLRAIYRHHNF